MAITLTNLNDLLISQLALDSFVAELAPLKAFSTNFNVTAALRGDTIEVPLISNITATTAENAYESADSGAMTALTMPLNNYRKCTVGIKDSQFYNSSIADISRFGTQLAAGVATAFSSLILSSINSTNYPSAITGVTASTFGLAGCRATRLVLSNNNAPRKDRCLVLNPTAYNSVLTDLSNAQVYGGTEAIRDGGPLSVYGMTIYESTTLPAGLIGFAAHPAAMAIAVRPFLPQSNTLYLEAKEMIDKDSGLSFTYRRHFAPSTGTMWATAEALAGFCVGVTSGLVRITA
jgi:hypothetical protein